MLERIQSLIDKGLDYSLHHPMEIVSLYEMYGETICAKCRKQDDIVVKFNQLERLKSRTWSKYKVVPGEVIDTIMTENPVVPTGHWTQANMTDELAEILIKNGYASKFLNPELINE